MLGLGEKGGGLIGARPTLALPLLKLGVPCMTATLDALVTYNPLTLAQTGTLADTVQRMIDYQARYAPVVDDRRCVLGVISRRELQILSACGTSSDYPVSQCAVPAVGLSHDAPLMAVVDALLAGTIHAVPVLDQQRLIGMITGEDVIRELSYGSLPCSRHAVSQYMTEEVVQIESTASAAEAIDAMDELGVDDLAVVKGECPIGVVSRRTLRLADSPQTAVAQLADLDAASCWRVDAISEAAGRMLDRDATSAAVVDRKNRFIGLLTWRRLMQAIKEAVVDAG
jgi:CBS domain-containing protein